MGGIGKGYQQEYHGKYGKGDIEQTLTLGKGRRWDIKRVRAKRASQYSHVESKQLVKCYKANG